MTQRQNFHFPGPNLIALIFKFVSFYFCLRRVFYFYHPLQPPPNPNSVVWLHLVNLPLMTQTYFLGGGVNINQVCDIHIYLYRHISVQWKLLQDNVFMNKKKCKLQ